MSGKERIVITKLDLECKHLNIVKKDSVFDDPDFEEGYYCSACPEGGFRKIDPKECEKCNKEKYFMGKDREQVRDIVALAICHADKKVNNCSDCVNGSKGNCDCRVFYDTAEKVVSYLLGE